MMSLNPLRIEEAMLLRDGPVYITLTLQPPSRNNFDLAAGPMDYNMYQPRLSNKLLPIKKMMMRTLVFANGSKRASCRCCPSPRPKRPLRGHSSSNAHPIGLRASRTNKPGDANTAGTTALCPNCGQQIPVNSSSNICASSFLTPVERAARKIGFPGRSNQPVDVDVVNNLKRFAATD